MMKYIFGGVWGFTMAAFGFPLTTYQFWVLAAITAGWIIASQGD